MCQKTNSPAILRKLFGSKEADELSLIRKNSASLHLRPCGKIEYRSIMRIPVLDGCDAEATRHFEPPS